MPGSQVTTDVLAVFLASVMATIIVLARGQERGTARRWASVVLVLCAAMALSAWVRFGQFHQIAVDADFSDTRLNRTKVIQNRPLHIHEFVHYYLGPKYFPEMGYLDIYHCVTLADGEIAEQDGHAPRINGTVRDLREILNDKNFEVAKQECRASARGKFTDARWESFKNDIRDISHYAHDGAWNGIVNDAGFNPPPSLVLFSYPLTNLIPVRSGTSPTYLFVTCIDLALLVVCFIVMRRVLGDITTSFFVIFFGATFLADYTWNGGSVLRFTWFVTLVCGLLALKQRRWELAGALLGLSTCDRIFPLMFAAAAMAPIALKARHSQDHRVILRRFATGFGIVVVVLVVASTIMFGPSSWSMFFERITKHNDVYHPQHIGLKKVLTFRSWVPFKSFGGAGGNDRYREWNLRLRDTWASVAPLAHAIQLIVAAATAYACTRRRTYEAAILGGIVYMFMFSLPANYYFCVFALIPAFALRSAATATTRVKRWKDFAIYLLFTTFALFTLLAWLLPGDDLTRTFRIATSCFVFLLVWIGLWSDVTPATWRAWRAASQGTRS